ncbi:MAG: restriction endonuclease subunit S, partial [Phycisphaerales bacterium]|nr:restriction endonuclease subunit S [Phycisphaerales bacterium]
PEWETKKAGQYFSHRKEKGKELLPIYSVTINNGMVLRSSFDRNFYDIKDPSGNKKVYKGDIAYNMMRMWQGACGVASEDCLVSPAYVVLAPKECARSDFFYMFFKLHDSLQMLTAYSRGLTKDRLRLYFDDFSCMPIPAPGKDEQNKIADALFSLDELIADQTRLIQSMNTHKKGLMQQLFPSLEEDQA